MARVYGVSDSECSFVSLVNSQLQQIQIDSLDEYNDYRKHYKDKKKDIIQNFDERIKEVNENIEFCYNQIRQDEYDLRKVERDLSSNRSFLIGKWGKLRKEIENKISNLINKRNSLISDISYLKNSSVKKQTEGNMLKKEKTEILYKFDADINKLYNLENNKQFRNKKQGAIGENQLIDYITLNFKNNNNFNLINGLNFDIIGGAININNSTKPETQIDHVLVCPKGVFFIETKSWNIYCTNDFKKNLFEQLNKIKRTFSYIFDGKIEDNITKFLLVGTEKKITLENKHEFVSLRLDELKDYLLSQKDILRKSDIILVLNKFSKYLPKERFSTFPRYKISLSSWFIDLKRKIKI